MSWFSGCSSADERKKRYRELAKKHHPDKGGDPKVMADINKEYSSPWESQRQQRTNSGWRARPFTAKPEPKKSTSGEYYYSENSSNYDSFFEQLRKAQTDHYANGSWDELWKQAKHHNEYFSKLNKLRKEQEEKDKKMFRSAIIERYKKEIAELEEKLLRAKQNLKIWESPDASHDYESGQYWYRDNPFSSKE